MKIHALCLVLAVSLAAAGPVTAQAAASKNFFLPSNEYGAGGTCASPTFKLSVSIGAGIVAKHAKSPKFNLIGSYQATTTVKVQGRPWLTAVKELLAPMGGGTTVTLQGAELDLGLTTTVKIGGLATKVAKRSRSELAVTVPSLPSPGWKPVSVTNAGGTATLQKGLGVLPLLDLPRPARSKVPFQIVYHGSQGDTILWAMALRKSGTPFVLPPFRHGLELDLFTLVPLPGSTVTHPSGVFRLRVPAVLIAQPIFLQCLALSRHPGYSPGSFTNLVRL